MAVVVDNVALVSNMTSAFLFPRKKKSLAVQAEFAENSLLSSFCSCPPHTIHGISPILQIPKDSSLHRSYLGFVPGDKQV